ncbi:MAG TPA: hypothetical protein H9662_00695 [Firmicutes bacterium]|nr:hypothetical protein [Bacillota bacterium]
MSKNYSVDDILAEVKHKKEQDGPAATTISHADELVEEILLERESGHKQTQKTAQETKMFPAAAQTQTVVSSIKREQPKQTLPQKDAGLSKVVPEEELGVSLNQEREQDVSSTKKPVYESTRSRNAAGYFTRSFRRIDSPDKRQDSNIHPSAQDQPGKISREAMQAKLQAKIGLTFTQQLPDVPIGTKYGVVGGEKKLAEVQKQSTQAQKTYRQSVTEAFERAAAGNPVFRDTAPVLFDTKSSLKINLPEKKEQPENNRKKEEPSVAQPQQAAEIPEDTSSKESEQQPFEVSEEVLSMQEELSKKREEKVKKFHLFDTEEPDEEEEEEPSVPEQESIDDFESYEDAESVQNDLNYTRFKVVVRLGVVAVLTVLSLYIGLSSRFSLPLPEAISAFGDPFLFLMINFGLLVAGALVCIGVIGRGLLSLFTFSPDSDSFCAAAVVGAAVQGAIFLAKPELVSQADGLQVLAPVALLILLCNCAGKLCMVDRIRRNFRLVSSQYDKYGVFAVKDEDFVFDMTKIPRTEDTVVVGHAKAGFLKGFLENSYAPDNADNISRYLAPICFGGGLVIGIACFLLTNNLYNAVTVFAATECMCVPAAAVLGMNLPLLRAGKSLSKTGAMITGASAVSEFGDALGIMVDVSEIIRPSDVEVNGIKMMNTPRMDEAILNAASLVCRVDSPLSGLFLQILQNRRDLLKDVDSVIYEDEMGLSGWVDGKRVLVGNRQLMLNHSISIPKVQYEQRTEKGTQYVVYVAVDGELSAMFLVLYRVSESVRRAMQNIEAAGFKVYIKTTDSNLDETKIAQMCGVDVGMLSMVPQYLYAEYDQKCAPRSNMKASVAYTGGIEAYFKVLVSCIRLKSSLSLTSAFYLCSAAIGLALIILFTLLGSTSVIKLLSVLVYQVFWIAATVIITNIKKC